MKRKGLGLECGVGWAFNIDFTITEVLEREWIAPASVRPHQDTRGFSLQYSVSLINYNVFGE